jgi:hypothetical protein
MNPLHEYVATQLAKRFSPERPIAVWYDPRREFEPFVSELSTEDASTVSEVVLISSRVSLIRFSGSYLAVRAAAEPLISSDAPPPLLIYVPGRERDRKESLFMELEKIGESWEPRLGNFARTVLSQKFSTGVVDDILSADVTYADLANLAAQETGGGSVLRAIYEDQPTNDGLLAAWLTSDARDEAIEAKGAKVELLKLIGSRLGADVPHGDSLKKARTNVLRYVLGSEFISDYQGDPPAGLMSLPKAMNGKYAEFGRSVAKVLRHSHASRYPALADAVEKELGPSTASIDPRKLGSIDTFRFEEQLLLNVCDDLIASGHHAEASRILGERESSFWVNEQPRRRIQWEASRRIAEVAFHCAASRKQIDRIGKSSASWVDAYSAHEGLYRVDLAYRRMETFVASMDEEPDAGRALGVVREEYDSLISEMARRFGEAFRSSQWQVPASLRQTSIYSKIVREQSGRTAYLFVDALRYEMGADLHEKLKDLGDALLVPAIGSLPTITPIGMASLLPGANAAFDVDAEKGKLGARVDGTFLTDVVSRRKFIASRLADSVDLTLGEVIEGTPNSLKKRIGEAPLVVVRSTEIDAAGEGGFAAGARQAMDTVLSNLSRAIRRLAGAGIKNFVITADHGHLFSVEKNDSMKIDSPGGDQIELHRRCWIGRGGKTPPGCVRLAAADLGYRSNLEFVFPLGGGVFKSGGDLAFHHGGISLQELVIPVITLKWRGSAAAMASSSSIVLSAVPISITNRMPTVEIAQAQMSMSPIEVRPVLMSGQRIVGKAEVALDASLDREKGVVAIGKEKATIGLILSDESVASARIVIFDASSDAILEQTGDISVNVV